MIQASYFVCTVGWKVRASSHLPCNIRFHIESKNLLRF